jgi:hypothetical protein
MPGSVPPVGGPRISVFRRIRVPQTWFGRGGRRKMSAFAESLTPVVRSVDRLCAVWNPTLTSNFKGKYNGTLIFVLSLIKLRS